VAQDEMIIDGNGK